MRIYITRVDDRPTLLPLPQCGALEVVGPIKPTYVSLPNNRAYAEVAQGEYNVVLDGTTEEFERIARHYQKGV